MCVIYLQCVFLHLITIPSVCDLQTLQISFFLHFLNSFVLKLKLLILKSFYLEIFASTENSLINLTHLKCANSFALILIKIPSKFAQITQLSKPTNYFIASKLLFRYLVSRQRLQSQECLLFPSKLEICFFKHFKWLLPWHCSHSINWSFTLLIVSRHMSQSLESSFAINSLDSPSRFDFLERSE